MVQHTYDLVVVGDHLGGLAAAALTAKAGRRVLLFENTEEIAEDRPMEYLNAICGGPEKEAGLGRFFNQLGLSPFGSLADDRIHFSPLHPPLQVILPGHRTNIFQDKVARDWEMAREFGSVQPFLDDVQRREEAFREHLYDQRNRRSGRSASVARRLLSNLKCYVRVRSLRKQAERESFVSFLTSMALPSGLAETLLGQAQGVARLLPHALPWSVGLRSVQMLQGGLYQNASGQSGVLNGLKEAFRRFGGECRPLRSLENAEFPRSEGARLFLSAAGKLQAGQVVFDLPLEESLSLLDGEMVKTLRRRKIDRRSDEWSFGLLRVRIRRDWRPECMGKYLVIDPYAGGLKDLKATLLVAGEPKDRSGGKSTFEMEVMGLFGPGESEEDRRRAMWSRLTDIMPFLEQGLAGEPRFRFGLLPRFTPQDRSWRGLENYYRTGRRLASFRLRQATFLRNEHYVGTGLAEGLLSGIMAVEG